jgi:AcrR family transcriptional regulator
VSARRGRPTLAQSAARDSAVLDAATQLFVDRGFADTTMDAVAARAATTKRSIYRRYPDKEALFMAVVEDMTTSFSDALFDEIDAGDSLEQGLELLALRLLDYMVSQSSLSLHRLVKTEAKRHVELARRVHDEIVVAAIADMAAALRKITAVHGGKLKESNAAAQLFFAVVTAECDTATEFGKPLPGRATCRATARRVARLFTGGLISAVPDQGGAGPVAKRSRRR